MEDSMPITEELSKALGAEHSEEFNDQLRDFQIFKGMLETAGVKLIQEHYDIPLINRMGHPPEKKLGTTCSVEWAKTKIDGRIR
jgi:hypothetical protein